MTDRKTAAVKPKSTALGTILTVAATAIVTYLAVKKQKEITDGVNKMMTAGAAFAQKMADGDLVPLAPKDQNGGRHAAPAN